jgi:DNA-binding response OmpR family regulator
MKVLVADDDPVSRQLLQRYLQKWGHEVAAAEDGAAAWRLFEAGDFPLVITDWMMPEVDGLDLIRRIRLCPRTGYVYAILLSSRSQKEDLVAGMEAGADDFLTKPFDRDELRVRVRAGERVIKLEHDLREARAALARAADAIDGPLSAVAADLAAAGAPGADPAALAGRLGQSLAAVQRARDAVRALRDPVQLTVAAS